MYLCLPRSGRHIFMHNVPPYISVSPCSQVLDTELDSHCIMLHFLLHKVFSHQIFVDIFHHCNILSILLLSLLIPLLSFNSKEIIYVFLTIFLYLLKCPQSLILSALRAFFFCGKPHISRSIFLYFRYQAWLKSW